MRSLSVFTKRTHLLCHSLRSRLCGSIPPPRPSFVAARLWAAQPRSNFWKVGDLLTSSLTHDALSQCSLLAAHSRSTRGHDAPPHAAHPPTKLADSRSALTAARSPMELAHEARSGMNCIVARTVAHARSTPTHEAHLPHQTHSLTERNHPAHLLTHSLGSRLCGSISPPRPSLVATRLWAAQAILVH